MWDINFFFLSDGLLNLAFSRLSVVDTYLIPTTCAINFRAVLRQASFIYKRIIKPRVDSRRWFFEISIINIRRLMPLVSKGQKLRWGKRAYMYLATANGHGAEFQGRPILLAIYANPNEISPN